MDVLGLSKLATPLVERLANWIPDPNERSKAAEALAASIRDIAHAEALAQVELNKEEAKHGNVFVAGWRPFIGWVCGAGLAYSFVLAPIIEWIVLLCGYTGNIPVIDTGLLLTMLTGMLGISGIRSFDKLRGTAAVGVTRNQIMLSKKAHEQEKYLNKGLY